MLLMALIWGLGKLGLGRIDQYTYRYNENDEEQKYFQYIVLAE
jgi:hypothetical protein